MKKQPYPWNLVIMVIVLSVITLSTACGSPPLVAPENGDNIAQSQEVVQAEPTATLEIIGGSMNSPLPSPTASAEPTVVESPTPSPSPASSLTPTATAEPTVVESPTPGPSPSPSSTAVGPPEEPPDTPIEGYIFGSPQEIPSTRQISGVEIVDWLPGSSTKVLLKGAFDVGVLNIETGEVAIYATVKEPGNIRFPVWMPNVQGVAYHSFDFQTNEGMLWIGKPGDEKSLILPETLPPIIPLEQGRIAIYDQASQAFRGVSSDARNLESLPTIFNKLPLSKSGPPGSTYRIAEQPNGEWIAYYNSQSFLLFNLQTGDIRPIDLGGEEPAPLWALNARWSPDGQKLALIITQGIPPIHFSDLYILDWPAATIQKVEDSFTFVNDITWAPDSKRLLFKAVVDRKDDFIINALYITDISTNAGNMLLPIPSEGLSNSFGGAVSWSPDGQQLLVMYSNESGVALYQIKVDVVVQ